MSPASLSLCLGVIAATAAACLNANGAARPPGALPPVQPGLAGTSWQLVKFEGGDGTTLTPDDRAKYMIAFDANGQLTARVDCNRGRGSWTSSGPGQLQFGPLALTRAACPAGSLHDQIVKQWSFVRSYVMRGGHLFLALMADGGIYEFEPVSSNQATLPRHLDGERVGLESVFRRSVRL